MGFFSDLIGTLLDWIGLGDLFDQPKGESGTKVNKQSNIAQIPVVYGERKVGGTRVFVSSSGSSNEYLYIVLALCEGEVQSIGDIYIDDVISTDSKFSGLLSITKYLGTDAQSADSTFVNASIGWTSAHRLRGVAYLAVRLKWSRDAFSGIPNIQAVVQGRKVWNGSSVAYSTNPVWCLRDYLTNARYGKGLATSFINDTQFTAAASKCDALVTPYSGGAQQKIFECNAVLQTDRSVLDNTKILLSGLRGLMPYQNGVYGVIVEDEGSSTFSLNESMIIGGLVIQSETKKSRFNRVIATFDNPNANWQSDQIEYPPSGSSEETTYLAADGGIELEKRITLNTVTDVYMAQDIAEIVLKRSRNGLTCKLTATSEALNVAVGDIVDVTHSTPAWSAKPFRVNALSLRMDGTVSVDLIEHQDSIYPWSTKTEVDNIPDTTLPDPFSVLAATNLAVVARRVSAADGTIFSVFDITWTASADNFVDQYRITITPSSGPVQNIMTSTIAHTFQVLDSTATYTVSITPINSMGVNGPTITSPSITPIGDTTAPNAPTALSVTGTFQKLVLKWTNPTAPDFAEVEIKRSSNSTESNATVIGKTRATTWEDGRHSGNTTRYYWIRAIDTSGNASAWASMGSATTVKLDANDFDDGVITPDFISSTFTSLIAGKATVIDVEAAQADIVTILNEQQSVGNTIDTVAARMLTLATTQSDTLGTVADAGITVDPTTGAVTIQAVESLRSQTATNLNAVQIDLDAAEATLSLKASVTYVNNTIAAAVLDSSDLAALNALEVSVTQAEIDIDGAEAAILLKADSTTVSGMNVRLNQAEVDIDGAEAAILLKASSTDLTAVTSRVTTAETTISALDIAAIANTVSDTRSLHDRNDIEDVRNLAQLMDVYKTREATNVEIAYARNEIAADVRDANVAQATNKLELAALIDGNAAILTSEQIVRADADSAMASSITTLTATVGDNTGAIATEQTVRADADSAMTTSITNLTSTVGTNTGAIATEQTTRADADSAMAASITSLTAITGSNTAGVAAEITARTSADSALSSLVSGVTTTVGNHTTSIASQSTSIDGIKAQYTVTIDNDGHVSGFGLVSDIIGGVATSSFTVTADQFAIGSDGNYPFVYYAADTTITKNGVSTVVPAGAYLDAEFIGANEINADKIVIDDNIEFTGTTSGLVFGKSSLGDSAHGAFYGRSLDSNGDTIAGFNISSPTSSIYADSAGQLALNNVRFFTGQAGAKQEFDDAGTEAVNISSLTTVLNVEIVGAGAGACNTAVPSRGTTPANGSAGTASWLEFWSGEKDSSGNVTGSLLNVGGVTRFTAAGATYTPYSVGSNNANHVGASGLNSSQPNSGGAGGGVKPYPNNGGLAGSAGTRGGGGGGGGVRGYNGSPEAYVNVSAKAGATLSQQINVPSGTGSVKLFKGTGGAGGASSGTTTGGKGGDGYISISDPFGGAIEVDLLDLLNRVAALEA